VVLHAVQFASLGWVGVGRNGANQLHHAAIGDPTVALELVISGFGIAPYSIPSINRL
jgi:hypothetical protein